MTKVSVIIPTRNRATMVGTAIESVLAQQYEGVELEVIVINDGSTDNTLDVIQNLPVRCIQGSGQGVSAARNLGLAAATGEFIAFLDDDDAWNSGYPHTQLALLQQHPEFGAVISQIMMADHELHPVAGPYPDNDLPSGWILNALFHYVPGVASTIVRASVVQEIGNFDVLLHGSEDWDWILRIAKHCQIGFVPEVSMIVRQHPTTRAFAKEHEEDITWRRFQDTIKVFRSHSQTLPIRKRIRLQYRLWKLRGWFVPSFIKMMRNYLQEKDFAKASKCLLLAIQISPAHTLSICYTDIMRLRKA